MVAKSDSVELDLPVSLAPQWDVGNVARVVGFVETTECNFRSILALGGVAEVKCKDWLVQKLLIKHAVERRWDSVDADSVISESQDAIKSAKGKGKTRLGSGFSEKLVLDCQITNGDGVLRNVTTERTRAVLNLKF